MNQRDTLQQARASVYAARQLATAFHNVLAHAISCTPTGLAREGLTSANIELTRVETMLSTADDHIADLLRKEVDK